jgi:hypothetical protein
MPFRPVGNILKRRLEQLLRMQEENTGASVIVARFAGGAGASVEYHPDDRVITITASSKTAASELMLRESELKREFRSAGITAERIIIR